MSTNTLVARVIDASMHGGFADGGGFVAKFAENCVGHTILSNIIPYLEISFIQNMKVVQKV